MDTSLALGAVAVVISLMMSAAGYITFTQFRSSVATRLDEAASGELVNSLEASLEKMMDRVSTYEERITQLETALVVCQDEKLDLMRQLLRSSPSNQAAFPYATPNAQPPPAQAVRTAPTPARAKVLGIWPVSDLETRREIDAIAKSGIAYVPVKGGATKRSVLEALSRDKPNILHVGAHANKDGVELDDGQAMIGWWRVVAGRSPFLRLIVLNACSTLSIVDALRDVGIPAVVGMRGDIGDAVSIEFVEDFYNRLMRGESVEEAAAVAALSLTYLTDQEMIVARDPDRWTIAKG